MFEKKGNFLTIWENIKACSFECPNGSICHEILGRPHSPKVSFKKLEKGGKLYILMKISNVNDTSGWYTLGLEPFDQ